MENEFYDESTHPINLNMVQLHLLAHRDITRDKYDINWKDIEYLMQLNDEIERKKAVTFHIRSVYQLIPQGQSYQRQATL